MNYEIKEQFKVGPPMVFFLIHGMQVGIGVLGFQRIVIEHSGYDGWISVIIAGIGISIILSMIYSILKRGNTDIIGIHQTLFGKWLGGLLNLILITYFAALAILVSRTYIEVVQVWIFEDMPPIILTVITVIFFYYLILGGFRAVVGLCVFGVILPSVMFFVMLLPLEYAHFINLLPIWKHSVEEILLGSKDTTLTFLGVEFLLMFYPFIKNAPSSLKWAQLGHWATVYTYTTLMIISLAFYSEEQLNRTIWATLTLLKVIELPFVERFEYIGISIWMIIIAPNIGLAFWAASRGLKQMFPIRQRYALCFFLLALLIINPLLQSREAIGNFNNYVSNFGFYFLAVYIPILFVTQLIVTKRSKKP
ncbi:GerAB/ArcD/ProY family transporter [Bacillus sp. FJAT-44742]|uniref:GerAB/ArcD/ProY family transporter n=1 Tax=Bacillus sp. FJAT-44742 TaxID=2014005 RepID=UPI000C24C834|nr:GerAB/ArcD/ProY family transporter [Bacillus sp. FJAT-44742]